MTSTIEEDFELELRSLPGVVNVGINHHEGGDVEGVVLSIRNHDPEAVRESAVQVASLYFPDAAVILEEASVAAPMRTGVTARITLAAAEFNAHDGISEVHLSYGGRIGVGRAGSGPLIGGAEATLAALRDLGNVIPFYLMGVTKVDTVIGCSVIVAFRSLSADDDRMGIARADDDLVSAAKATLDALNRYVTMDPDRHRDTADSEEAKAIDRFDHAADAHDHDHEHDHEHDHDHDHDHDHEHHHEYEAYREDLEQYKYE
jgi:hypothetical protein